MLLMKAPDKLVLMAKDPNVDYVLELRYWPLTPAIVDTLILHLTGTWKCGSNEEFLILHFTKKLMLVSILGKICIH